MRASRLSIRSKRNRSIDVIFGFLAHLLLFLVPTHFAIAQSNPIIVENAKPGSSPSEWDVNGPGDASIQGFATDISVNKGQVIRFKVKTDATDYRLDIYRLGYYGGLGARLIVSILPSVSLPQDQPNPISDGATGLIDCGNWAESASWSIPPDAVSGVYIARLVRTDTGGASHIVFVVRDDASNSDLLFQTSDTTWQAYNRYGGNSLYFGSPAGRAYKVSYNRPLIVRGLGPPVYGVFAAEYPMIRWLEANGYDVSYTTGVDTDRRGNLLTNHKIFLSVGHDEYWSGNQRANVEAARGSGVNLAFFSGNDVFWKTRWEPSIDGSGTPYRTLVCYKETKAGAKIDPTSTWTGTWRDPRFSPPSDGGRPENALTGTLFTVNVELRADSLMVPASYGAHRFWRNTSVATLSAGQIAAFAPGTLGYEWNECPDNGFQPAGLMRLSLATVSNVSRLQDYGTNYPPGQEATHSLSLYRHGSGALVFSAGTVQWSWGLDAVHDGSSSTADPRMQQATVNLFADMAVQPASLQPGLVPTTQSSDVIAPTSTIHAPLAGTNIPVGSQVQITGTASDPTGRVWEIEVSTDDGNTWHRADGRENWSYAWTPAASGSATITSRAVDDSGNLETPGAGVNVTIVGSQLTIWSSSMVPGVVDGGPDNPVELGVKLYSEVGGTITGIRFYKSSNNTGTHVGSLWTSTGTLLASATFTNETPSGWQQVNFATPVPISSFTTYVASYHTSVGGYSADISYFSSIGADNSPLHALVNGGSWGGNGVYSYGNDTTFPNQTWNATNYWVDVVLQAGPPPTLTSITVTPSAPNSVTGATQQFTATGTYSDGTTRNLTNQVTWTSSNTAVATINANGLATGASSGTTTISATQSGVSGNTALTIQSAPLTITTTSLINGVINSGYSVSLAANGGTPPYTWSITSGSLPPGVALNQITGAISGTPTTLGSFDFVARVEDAGDPVQTTTKSFNITIASPASTIWPSNAVPSTIDVGADNGVELGVKFRSDVAGTIRGIRFYKASTNTGTHVGNLWSSTGTLLASATFTGETASGWQQVNFDTPVAITANTVYVASYHTNTGHYSINASYFTSSGVDNAPLHALANSVSPNGVYRYGASSLFPNQTWNASNYWVDVLFQTGPSPTLSSIAVAPTSPNIVPGATLQFTATGTYSDGTSQNLTNQVNWTSSSAAFATISGTGLATGLSVGTTTISATLSGLTGIATLTVQAAPLTITTSSLPSGLLNTTYSASLAASGGTLPYSWIVDSGSLPPGLTLNTSSGVISGTPTSVGSYGFSVRVTDASNPTQTLTRALNITVVSSAPITIWPSSTVPGVIDSGPDSAVQLGVKFRSDVAGTIRGIRFYKAAGNTGTHVASLWSSGGTRLANATFSNETASGWQEVIFATPVAISANTVYVASYHTTTGHYSINSNYFASSGADNAPLHALANGVSGGNGVYAYGSSNAFPNQTWNASNYWVDVIFQAN